MAGQIAITATGKKKFEEELALLQDITIPEIKDALRKARENGDLSENADYTAAREALAEANAREAKLKGILSNAIVINDWDVDTSSVQLGTIVEIENMDSHVHRTVKIVGSTEVGITEEMIYITPDALIVTALMGHKKGDIVDVNAPIGTVRQKILRITNEKQRAQAKK